MSNFLQTALSSELFPFLVGSVAVVLLLLIWNLMLEWRLRRLCKGANGNNLEAHISSIARDYEEFTAFKKTMEGRIEDINTRVQGSLRGVGMIRFNPFAGSGSSKPSFAAAFLSESGDGLVISTLHARDSVSIFTKNIVKFVGEQELTDEEQQALEKAKNSLHT